MKNVRSRISCLIESPGLYGNMSAYDNLAVKCRLFGINDKRYIENILKTVGLSNVGKKKTKHFSLGMKQRLGIGMALVGEPDLLLLDEPINGLDPQGIAEIRDMIFKLRDEQNMTIIISSHILEELSKIATHYGIIHNGTLVQEITKEELMQRCGERMEIFLDDPKQALAHSRITFSTNAKNRKPLIYPLAAFCFISVFSICFYFFIKKRNAVCAVYFSPARYTGLGKFSW